MNKTALIKDEDGNVINAIVLHQDQNPADWGAEWAEESNDVLADQVRVVRNKLLTETDWWALSDVTMTEEQAAYRQALRDVTSQSGFPEDVNWPIKPE